MNTRTCLLALSAVLVVPMSGATVYFADDFSKFNSGNLVGQNGWAQRGTQATSPLQVTGGKVQIGGGQTADNQDAIRAASPALTAGTSLFMAARFSLSDAPSFTANSGNGSSYFFAIRSGGFDNGRIVAKRSQTNSDKFILGLRATGQSANSFVWGTQELDFNTEHTIVQALDVVAGATNDVFTLFVNPTSSVRGNNTAYATQVNAGTDPAAPFDGVVISQFGNSSGVTSAAVAIGGLALTDDFSEALAVVPEPGTMAALGLGALALMRRRRK